MSAEDVGTRWQAVRARVDEAARRAGRAATDVTLVAVSKTQPLEAVLAAWAAGARDFGENYAQELADKAARMARADARWHFIGHLQTNKAKLVAGVAAVIETVDSARLLAAIAARAGAAPAGAASVQRILVQVNVGDEAQKGGVAAEGLPALLDAALAEPRVQVDGLMAIPPQLDDAEAMRPFFARLRALRDREAARTGAPLATLSMGMSADFEVAIAEGATSVRVGTAIFGERARKPAP
jgi:pyridoxal phosphate enzyme (YggS family)